MTDTLGRIERQIDIDASAERVWELVSRPGWWINDDTVDPEPDLHTDGDVAVLTHPEWGTFRIGTEQQDPPRHIAFRWLERDRPEAGGETGTLVEFWIDDRPGGVVLKVVESGFEALGKDADAVREHVADNTEGWEKELAAAQRFVLGERS